MPEISETYLKEIAEQYPEVAQVLQNPDEAEEFICSIDKLNTDNLEELPAFYIGYMDLCLVRYPSNNWKIAYCGYGAEKEFELLTSNDYVAIQNSYYLGFHGHVFLKVENASKEFIVAAHYYHKQEWLPTEVGFWRAKMQEYAPKDANGQLINNLKELGYNEE